MKQQEYDGFKCFKLNRDEAVEKGGLAQDHFQWGINYRECFRKIENLLF